MLTKEENELLTRVGPGTPMGELFRRYWLPALLSLELPEPDCAPVRVRLLGEDLVAFRDTNGRVGLLAENCSHRRASLFYGRNEECGLRCIYHGWKYDVEGRIVDTPAEPAFRWTDRGGRDPMQPSGLDAQTGATGGFRDEIRHRAYPCREVNGLILTYMGLPDKMPLLPKLPWLELPQDHVLVDSKFFNECNWLQALEGDLDSTHLAFLHRRSLAAPMPLSGEFETQVTSWGVKAACARPAADGQRYIRTNVFAMPCIGMPPIVPSIRGINDGAHGVYQVPADDYHVWRFDVVARRSVRIDEAATHYAGPAAVREVPGGRYDFLSDLDRDFRKLANKSNDYLVDRAKQRTTIYSGIDFSNHTQDACVTESMGPIVDRTQEHLGVGDTQVAAVRQFLLRALRELEAGEDPPGVAFDEPDHTFDDLFIVDAVLAPDVPWTDAAAVRAAAVAPRH